MRGRSRITAIALSLVGHVLVALSSSSSRTAAFFADAAFVVVGSSSPFRSTPWKAPAPFDDDAAAVRVPASSSSPRRRCTTAIGMSIASPSRRTGGSRTMDGSSSSSNNGNGSEFGYHYDQRQEQNRRQHYHHHQQPPSSTGSSRRQNQQQQPHQGSRVVVEYVSTAEAEEALAGERAAHAVELKQLHDAVEERRLQLKAAHDEDLKRRLSLRMQADHHRADSGTAAEMCWSENHNARTERLKERLRCLMEENGMLVELLATGKSRAEIEEKAWKKKAKKGEVETGRAKEVLRLERATFETSIKLLEAGVRREHLKIQELQRQLIDAAPHDGKSDSPSRPSRPSPSSHQSNPEIKATVAPPGQQQQQEQGQEKPQPLQDQEPLQQQQQQQQEIPRQEHEEEQNESEEPSRRRDVAAPRVCDPLPFKPRVNARRNHDENVRHPPLEQKLPQGYQQAMQQERRRVAVIEEDDRPARPHRQSVNESYEEFRIRRRQQHEQQQQQQQQQEEEQGQQEPQPQARRPQRVVVPHASTSNTLGINDIRNPLYR